MENIIFNSFSIGTNSHELKQVNNTFQIIDNFSKVVGLHTLKFGVEFHYDQINTNPIAQFNGSFIFTGSDTGNDFADFLLGLPSQYNQSQLEPFYPRSKYWGLFAQDSWRMRSDLTLNYGLRWDRIEPWYEKNNGLSTFVAGKQSRRFSRRARRHSLSRRSRRSRTLAPPGTSISRRASAWPTRRRLPKARSSEPHGWARQHQHSRRLWHVLLGDRGALGRNPCRQRAFRNHLFQSRAAAVCHALHHRVQRTVSGTAVPRRTCPARGNRSNPNPNVDWSQYVPITGIPGYATSNRIPYVEEYMLSIERQLGSNTVFSISYVGAQGHRLLVMEEANPGIPALCLQTPGCGPFAENGSRGPLGNNFGSDTLQKTIGKSNYNSLQLSLRHTSGRLVIAAGYTYGKSMDNSSNLGEEINPVDPAISYGLVVLRYPAELRGQLQLPHSVREPLARLQPLDEGLGDLRHHAFFHRPARHPAQQHGQLAARHQSQRHQQQRG